MKQYISPAARASPGNPWVFRSGRVREFMAPGPLYINSYIVYSLSHTHTYIHIICNYNSGCIILRKQRGIRVGLVIRHIVTAPAHKPRPMSISLYPVLICICLTRLRYVYIMQRIILMDLEKEARWRVEEGIPWKYKDRILYVFLLFFSNLFLLFAFVSDNRWIFAKTFWMYSQIIQLVELNY